MVFARFATGQSSLRYLRFVAMVEAPMSTAYDALDALDFGSHRTSDIRKRLSQLTPKEWNDAFNIEKMLQGYEGIGMRIEDDSIVIDCDIDPNASSLPLLLPFARNILLYDPLVTFEAPPVRSGGTFSDSDHSFLREATKRIELLLSLRPLFDEGRLSLFPPIFDNRVIRANRKWVGNNNQSDPWGLGGGVDVYLADEYIDWFAENDWRSPRFAALLRMLAPELQAAAEAFRWSGDLHSDSDRLKFFLTALDAAATEVTLSNGNSALYQLCSVFDPVRHVFHTLHLAFISGGTYTSEWSRSQSLVEPLLELYLPEVADASNDLAWAFVDFPVTERLSAFRRYSSTRHVLQCSDVIAPFIPDGLCLFDHARMRAELGDAYGELLAKLREAAAEAPNEAALLGDLQREFASGAERIGLEYSRIGTKLFRQVTLCAAATFAALSIGVPGTDAIAASATAVAGGLGAAAKVLIDGSDEVKRLRVQHPLAIYAIRKAQQKRGAR
jgi:hypothetical protein